MRIKEYFFLVGWWFFFNVFNIIVHSCYFQTVSSKIIFTDTVFLLEHLVNYWLFAVSISEPKEVA